MKTRLFLLAALLLTSFRPAPAGGDTGFEAARLNSVAANPPGVSLTLSLPSGRTQFHQGEVIPLTAVFASSLPKAYQFNTGPGDREIPWNSDAFQVDDPAGAVDPLAAYYAHEFPEAYSGGGPHFQALTAQPVSIPYTLNEWLRFDAPGRYRVYLTSGRVVDADWKWRGSFRLQGRATTSSAVDLEILPADPALDAQTLQQALPLFNEEGFNPRTQIARQAAVRAIRFLGTPDAARAMVARYGYPTDYEQGNYFSYRQTRLGLFGFPRPSLVIQEMERRLADPDFCVFNDFLYDLAQAQFFSAYPQAPALPAPTDPVRDRERQKLLRRRLDARTALTDLDLTLLAAAVPGKQGKARAVSLYTLLQMDYAHQDAAEHRDLARELTPIFDDLTLEEQNNLLGDFFWPLLRGPDVLPLLRRLYARPSPGLEPGTAQGNDEIQRYSLALRRLTDLSPAEGRALLLAEIKSPHPRIDVPTLCSLPDRTLPDLDAVLATKLEDYLQEHKGDWKTPSRLVERYATQAILPRVKAAYGDEGEKWGSDIQSDLLAYFLRTDHAYGVKELGKALAARTGSLHYRYILSGVAALLPGPDPDLERLASGHLHDPDPEVVVDAVKTLGSYGSAAAEAPLWARMREWHQQWAGKAERITPGSGQLEYVLASALATAPGWLANRTKLQALENLCVTPGARGNVAEFLRQWAGPVRISFEETRGEWSVAQYGDLSSLTALESKLAQFPRGTQFRLSSWAFSNRAQQMKAFRQLKPFLEKRGKRLGEEPFPAHWLLLVGDIIHDHLAGSGQEQIAGHVAGQAARAVRARA